MVDPKFEPLIVDLYRRIRAETGRIPTTRELAGKIGNGITKSMVLGVMVKHSLERSKRRGRRAQINEVEARAYLLRFLAEDITLRQLSNETGWPSSTLYSALIRANGGAALVRVEPLVEIVVEEPPDRKCLRCGAAPIKTWICKRCKQKNAAQSAGAIGVG